MRKRFKMSRIASSDNYELSRKIHAMYLQRFHEENIEVITEISSTLVIKEQKYIWEVNSCFRRRIENT
jgi:hypothetical protein